MQCNALAGSFHFSIQLPEKRENDIKDKEKRKELSDDEKGEKKANIVEKKRKQRSVCDDEEEEQAGPSSPVTPGQSKKSKKVCFCKLLATDVYFCKYYCILHDHIYSTLLSEVSLLSLFTLNIRIIFV